LPGTNTLAYYKKSVNCGRKKFYSTGNGSSLLHPVVSKRKKNFIYSIDTSSQSLDDIDALSQWQQQQYYLQQQRQQQQQQQQEELELQVSIKFDSQ
jgi:hypothetical protein